MYLIILAIIDQKQIRVFSVSQSYSQLSVFQLVGQLFSH